PKIRSIPQKFYQFSLSPEGEAEQAAIKAFKEGYRFAGVITPQNKWGERVQEAFTQRWHELGGRVVSSAKLKPEYDQSQTISQLMNVDDSQKRSLKVKNMLVEKVSIQPRRRQDIDVVVLIAPAAQARLVKPLLEFYFAGNLPVYATSSVYQGQENPKKDRDMNGIVFC